MMTSTAAVLLLALIALVVAHEGQTKGERKNKWKKNWEECEQEAECKKEMLAFMENKADVPDDNKSKTCFLCLMKKSEIIDANGNMNEDKCQSMSKWFAKGRDDKLQALQNCCTNKDAASPEDMSYTLCKCLKDAVAPEPLLNKKGQHCKGKKGE